MNESTRDPEQMLDTIDAAQYLGIAPKTLRNYRCLSKGPHFFKAVSERRTQRGRVVYRIADLDAWRDEFWQAHKPPREARSRP